MVVGQIEQKYKRKQLSRYIRVPKNDRETWLQNKGVQKRIKEKEISPQKKEKKKKCDAQENEERESQERHMS